MAAGTDRAAAEDPSLPAPRQVVRRRPRAPRVRAAVLRADRPARSEQRRRAPSNGAAVSEERELAAARVHPHARARCRGGGSRSQGDPLRAGRAARHAHGADRSGDRSLQPCARSRRRVHPGARQPGADLRGPRLEPRARGRDVAEGQRAHGQVRRGADAPANRCALRDQPQRSGARRPGVPRGRGGGCGQRPGAARARSRPRSPQPVARSHQGVGERARRRPDRARANRHLDPAGEVAGGAVPQGRHRGGAARAGARDRSEPRGGVLRPRAELQEAPSVARSGEHLRPPRGRDARAQDQGRALQRHRPGVRRRGRGQREGDRRVQEHRRPGREQRRGPRSVGQAVRQARRRRAVDRLHDPRGGPDDRLPAAGGVVLQDRQGARREAGRSRGGPGSLRDGARSRSVALAEPRGAQGDRDRQRGLRQGRAVHRPGAELHGGPPATRAPARRAREAA